MSTELNLTLPDNLAKEAEAIGLLSQEAIVQLLREAIEHKRSQLALAEVETDWSQLSTRELIEKINIAYADELEEEKEYLQIIKRHHKRILEEDEW
jgi:hypothetical protein